MAPEAHIVDDFKLAEREPYRRYGSWVSSLGDEPEVDRSTGKPLLIVHRVGAGSRVVAATIGPGKLALLSKPTVAHVDLERSTRVEGPVGRVLDEGVLADIQRVEGVRVGPHLDRVDKELSSLLLDVGRSPTD